MVFVCFPFIQTNVKAVFRPCRRNWLFLSQSVYLVFSFSRVFCLYCVFSPNPCNIITGHSIHWPFLIQLHADTFTHTLHSLSLLLPLPFSLSSFVTHINSDPPSTNLPLPSLTSNHSLPFTWNDCETTKTLGKHQIPHHSRGGLKTAKILLSGRKLWTRLRGWQSSRRKKTAMCPDCRLIVMPILYYTSQPLINYEQQQPI